MSDTELGSMSEPEGRLEVVEGSGRRRSWSAEEKERIVGETLSGGESVSAVARRHGVTAQQLYSWRRRAGIERIAGNEELGFAAVLVARSAIEIELCGMTIRVPSGSDGATLRAVLQAAKAVS
jgi:transposase